MTFEEVLETRRSVRRFKPDPVPAEKLEHILDLAAWAPSAMNSQNWKFIVIKGEKVEQIRGISSRAFKEHVKKELEKVFEKYPQVIEATGKYFKTLGNAPVVICVYRGETVEGLIPDVESVAAATQNLVLAAHSTGLAACWMTGILPLADEINKVTGETGMALQAIVTIGYSAMEAQPPKRKKGRIEWIGWD
ncbi:nitroreductase family protein [bacterium]|nr:nitroreductase family protein [bacterium]